jgi:hypothetical protein
MPPVEQLASEANPREECPAAAEGKMRAFPNIAFALFCAAILAGCTTPYAVPVIEEGLSGTPPPSFEGVADMLAQGDTRVIWIHGMCDHDVTWAENRQRLLLEALDAERAADTSPAALAAAGAADGYIWPFEAKRNGHTLFSRFLIWSPMTRTYKDRLIYDNSDSETKPDEAGAFPYERASLNRSLKKTLLNRCLIDAVAYAGPNGDGIRQWVEKAVCEALGGSFDRKCDIPPAGVPPRTVLVAESLGSKLLFDALRKIWRGNSGPAMAAQLASVQQVYLLANQIPLLDAADLDLDAVQKRQASSIESGLSALADAHDRARRLRISSVPDLQVIAFTDPNDLLSYRLSKEILREQRVQVVNVIVSNAPTYFGFVEMPDAAHCGYKWNLHVFGTLVHGYEGGRVIAVKSDPERVCGLVNEG